MFGAGVLALITMGTMDIPFEVRDLGQFIFWMSMLILISNVICHNYRVYLYKHYSVTFLAFTDFISPLFTAFYSWLFLQEKITWHYGLSAIIVLAGLYIFYQDELKSIYVQPVSQAQ
jgi:drug/metabolite transporter (DMT)-like permease